MIIKRLHHAAFRCRDARETVDFYVEKLGLKFVHAMGEDHVPSTGEYSPHVHIFLEMEDGSCIAFFELPKDSGNMKDMEMPEWVQHFAFKVESLDVLKAEKERLESLGVDVLGPINHDDFIMSIYFFDPNGHRLEFTADTCAVERKKVFNDEAYEVLDLWSETHDWSQREKMFGGKTGYERK
ncbi:MAG: VOC family protein [Gammaproteobacteria bacterium]|jgi:glyoxylase I family protein|nr:VOC family protein [Gammaproteobacteria bacterium]MBT5073199.1 VOC family protein [Kordiimonadaceae bacterium]MBT6036566.1 VOC family protein [Kordiimonadaceae bacterium]MBT7582413.1 VOC family protein [Kordiimonadaceae bacterium]